MADPVYAFNINYDVPIGGLTLNHQHRIRVVLADGQDDPEVGTALSDIQLRTRGVGAVQGSVDADVGLGEYLSAMMSQFDATVNINAVALTFYPFGLSGSGIYASAADLSDGVSFPQLVGDALAGTPITAQGSVYTYVGSHGAMSKLVLMETNSLTNLYNGYSSLTTDEEEYVDYLLSSLCIVAGVQDSYPIAFNILSTSQNEALYPKRFPKG
jgi:hypothetical protein